MLCESDRLQFRSSGGPMRVQPSGRIVGKFLLRRYVSYQRDLSRRARKWPAFDLVAPALLLHLVGVRFLATTQLD